jgi:hypothetical protein
MKSMCCLCIQFTHENTSERTILHLVKTIFCLVACTAKKASYAPVCRLNFHPEHLNSSRVYLCDSCCSICSFFCSVFEIIIGRFIFFLLVQYIVCPSIYGFWLFLWHLRFSSEFLYFKITTFILLLTLKYLHHNKYMGFGFT